MNNLTRWIFFRVYRLNLHFDPVLCRRWRWRKYFMRDGRVLEIGPGGGPWTIELLLRGNEVTAVDVAISSLRRLKKKAEAFPLKRPRLSLVNCHAANFKSRKQYDQIILFEVLEHIREDEKALKNLASYLAPGGRLLLSTPSHDHIPISGEGVSDCEDGGHVRKGYSFSDYELLLESAGLKILKKDSAGGLFTRKATGLSNSVYKCTGSTILLYLSRLIFRPLAYLDPLVPGYPRYINFIIAGRKDDPL